MLTAWATAGIVGPWVFAQFKGVALYVAAAFLVVGFFLALLYKQPAHKKAA